MTQAYYRKTPQQALEAQNASAEGLSAQEARRRAEPVGDPFAPEEVDHEED